MVMLLRTSNKKVALAIRVAIVCVVTFTYLTIALLSNENENIKIESSAFHSRRLLARDLNTSLQNNNESDPTIEADHVNWTNPNCTHPAIHEFPSDGLTKEQRQHGLVLIHVLLACYLFIFLAVVCDDYFVPCIKMLCDTLQMKEDVAGATFMAIASSSAEIFINSIGTFITEGDLGVGTIVGSAVFNILAVPACCGFFAHMVIELEWYALTRDSFIYGCAVVLLITFLYDGRIYYYEALILVLIYILYILVMIYNDKLSSWFYRTVRKVSNKNFYIEIRSENRPLLNANGKVNTYNGIDAILDSDITLKYIKELDLTIIEESTNIWIWPSEASKKGKCWFILTWPIGFILHMTTPSTRTYPNLYVVTFLMCVFWIGITAYVVAWLITIIGDTLNIPDSVMGLTFLAAGTSVPEAVSSVLVTNQGHGSMGISSSIGSNTFDILLCLGLPWFIKSAYYPKLPGQFWITINSQGISYSAGCLLSTLVLLYVSLYYNNFRLNWKIGLTCLVTYVCFLIFATLLELNVFFPVNLPTCDV